jgi:hypothetical protein
MLRLRNSIVIINVVEMLHARASLLYLWLAMEVFQTKHNVFRGKTVYSTPSAIAIGLQANFA